MLQTILVYKFVTGLTARAKRLFRNLLGLQIIVLQRLVLLNLHDFLDRWSRRHSVSPLVYSMLVLLRYIKDSFVLIIGV